MTEDSELLRRYADEKSQAAFAEIVNRHINPVYAGALRRLGGDAHLAQDVTQRVFTALAARAGELTRHAVLAGWLHLTTRNIAAQIVRAERRRTAREQEAQIMTEPDMSDSTHLADWDRLRPVLDDTLDELDDRDREAVILRFFEGKSFADVGARLQLTENAARMRTERALDRMHRLLSRRGVTSTVGALTAVLASQAQVTAPAGLAATVTGSAVSATLAAGTGWTFLNFMNTAKIIAATSSLVAVAAICIAVGQYGENERDQAALAAGRRELGYATERIQALELELTAATRRATAAETGRDKLLAALDGAQREAATQAPTLVSTEAVQARFARAQQLARDGDKEGALAEYLWLYDEGMVRAASLRPVRNSFLTGALGRLAVEYPPAMEALRQRRDKAEELMLSSDREPGAAMDFAALNRAMGDQVHGLEVFDQLPSGDMRRKVMVSTVYDQLLAARRYTDIAEGRPYAQMASMFDAMAADRPVPANIPNPEQVRQTMRANVVTQGAKNIEVLAGSGQMENARALAEKVLAYDSSAETRAAIQEHATRAGHPELLALPPTR